MKIKPSVFIIVFLFLGLVWYVNGGHEKFRIAFSLNPFPAQADTSSGLMVSNRGWGVLHSVPGFPPEGTVLPEGDSYPLEAQVKINGCILNVFIDGEYYSQFPPPEWKIGRKVLVTTVPQIVEDNVYSSSWISIYKPTD